MGGFFEKGIFKWCIIYSLVKSKIFPQALVHCIGPKLSGI